MASRLEAFSVWFYSLLLRIYPAPYRERFAFELMQVFRALYRQTRQDAGIMGALWLGFVILVDGMWSALVQWSHYLFKRRSGMMNTAPVERTDGSTPLSFWQTALAVLPFLLFGLASIVDNGNFLRLQLPRTLFLGPYMVFNWLILLGLAAGIIAGFPRWAFSYLGWALLIAWWWSDMSFNGQSWHYRIWLPFLAVVGISLLLRRSLRPLRILVAGLWRDMTLFSFGIYILFTFPGILADENHNPYLLYLILATTLGSSLGAWGFFSTTSPLKRVLSLIGGVFLMAVFGYIDSITWDYHAYYGLPDGGSTISYIGILVYAFLLLLFLGLGWITGRVRQVRKS